MQSHADRIVNATGSSTNRRGAITTMLDIMKRIGTSNEASKRGGTLPTCSISFPRNTKRDVVVLPLMIVMIND